MAAIFDTIQSFVKDNSDLFEKIVLSNDRKTYNDGDVYNILDYQRILAMIGEYVTGYVAYRDKKEDSFESSKIIEKTKKFYDSLFSESGYRRKFNLPEMPEINKQYLILSNELKKVLVQMIATNDNERDLELETFIQLTSNQYKKLSKVYKDDMKLWLWLSFLCDCSEDLKKAHRNNNTPVIHKEK